MPEFFGGGFTDDVSNFFGGGIFGDAGNIFTHTVPDQVVPVVNKITDTGNKFFDNNGKWIGGQAIDALPLLLQVLGSAAGTAAGTATGDPLLIPIGGILGAKLGLAAGNYSSQQLHQVAGVGLKPIRGRGRPKKGSGFTFTADSGKPIQTNPEFLKQVNDLRPLSKSTPTVKGGKIKLVKGSSAAKEYMASIRAKRKGKNGAGLYM